MAAKFFLLSGKSRGARRQRDEVEEVTAPASSPGATVNRSSNNPSSGQGESSTTHDSIVALAALLEIKQQGPQQQVQRPNATSEVRASPQVSYSPSCAPTEATTTVAGARLSSSGPVQPVLRHGTAPFLPLLRNEVNSSQSPPTMGAAHVLPAGLPTNLSLSRPISSMPPSPLQTATAAADSAAAAAAAGSLEGNPYAAVSMAFAQPHFVATSVARNNNTQQHHMPATINQQQPKYIVQVPILPQGQNEEKVQQLSSTATNGNSSSSTKTAVPLPQQESKQAASAPIHVTGTKHTANTKRSATKKRVLSAMQQPGLPLSATARIAGTATSSTSPPQQPPAKLQPSSRYGAQSAGSQVASTSVSAQATEVIRVEEVEAALRSKPQRGKKRENLSLSERLELTRTRNREHAKSTRIRKKMRYQELLEREAECLVFKKEKDLQSKRRRCIVDFMSFLSERSRNGQLSGLNNEEAAPSEESSVAESASRSRSISVSASEQCSSETTPEDLEHGHEATEMQETKLEQGGSAQSSVVLGEEGAVDGVQQAQVQPTSVVSSSKVQDAMATDEETNETTSKGDDELLPKRTLLDFVQDRSLFLFSSHIAETNNGNGTKEKGDGLSALAKHEAACKECVVQQFGISVAETTSYDVVDAEDGVALVRDVAFAEFSLDVTLGASATKKSVAKGVIRVQFAEESDKIRKMQLCSYDLCCPLMQEAAPLRDGKIGEENAPTAGASSNSSSNQNNQKNRMVLPISFPSVVSENSFHEFAGGIGGSPEAITDGNKKSHASKKTVSNENHPEEIIEENLGLGMNYENLSSAKRGSSGAAEQKPS